MTWCENVIVLFIKFRCIFYILIIDGIFCFVGGNIWYYIHTFSGEGEPIILLHSGGMTGLVEYEEQAALLESKIIKPFALI